MDSLRTAGPKAIWRKSTHSTHDGQCVEVALNLPGVVVVRDSKNRGGPTLIVEGPQWIAFIDSVKHEALSFS
jgi:hypothetical protein